MHRLVVDDAAGEQAERDRLAQRHRANGGHEQGPGESVQLRAAVRRGKAVRGQDAHEPQQAPDQGRVR